MAAQQLLSIDVVFITLGVALVGLAVGSFLNVVIWRVPRGESVSHPPSACPGCGNAIRARDNIPVLSWLILRRKCRDCGEPISARYPFVELATSLFFAAVTVHALVVGYGVGEGPAFAALPAFLYLAAISVALAAIDIDVRKLPNRIVLPSIVVGAVLLAIASLIAGDWGALLRAGIGSVALFVFYFILVLAYPSGMGFGDVKLAAVLGLYLGWVGWDALVVGAFAAFLGGGLFSIGLVVFRKAGRSTAIPFGPWMLLGTWVGIFFGPGIARGYLSLVGLG